MSSAISLNLTMSNSIMYFLCIIFFLRLKTWCLCCGQVLELFKHNPIYTEVTQDICELFMFKMDIYFSKKIGEKKGFCDPVDHYAPVNA